MLAILLLVIALAIFSLALWRVLVLLRQDPAATRAALILFFGVNTGVWILGGIVLSLTGPTG